MKDLVTLIIILHNRHSNLDRLLEYYSDHEFPIVIADSSQEPHIFKTDLKHSVKYIYIPGTTYTQKIEKILKEIYTDYVAMCADDDFIVPAGLQDCVNFLNKNPDYSSVQGKIIKYYATAEKQKVRFDLLYEGDFTLSDPSPLERLKRLFDPYKSLLYAVHRTAIFQKAFEGAGDAFGNLYLNEYLASIIPVLHGKSKDLNSFYQVREYSESSDDKWAENLDIIIKSDKYEREFRAFLDHLTSKGCSDATKSRESLTREIIEALHMYARQLVSFKVQAVPFKKKLGAVVQFIPVIGKKIVENRRYQISMEKVGKYLSTGEMSEVDKIKLVLKNDV